MVSATCHKMQMQMQAQCWRLRLTLFLLPSTSNMAIGGFTEAPDGARSLGGGER